MKLLNNKTGHVRRCLGKVIKLFVSAGLFLEIAMGAADGDYLDYLDVSQSDYFAQAAHNLKEQGIMTGISSSHFSGSQPLNRAALSVLIYRMADGTPSSLPAPFEDCSANAYYSKALAWCFQNGIINGKSAYSYGPEDPVTRQDFVTMLYRLDNRDRQESAGEFSDWDQVSAYAWDPVNWAVNAGILKGSEGFLNPQKNCSRAEAAVLLDRYLQLYGRASIAKVPQPVSISEIQVGRTRGKLYQGTEESSSLVILSHGLGSNLDGLADLAGMLAENGIDALCLEFTAAGFSPVDHLQMTISSEAQDLKEAAASLPYEKIALMGHSQGGLVSALAAGEQVSSLILLAPAFSLPDLIRTRFPYKSMIPASYAFLGVILGRGYALDAWDMDPYGVKFDGPVLIVHGRGDTVILPSYALKADAFYPDSHLLLYPYEGHLFTEGVKQQIISKTISLLRFSD